MTGFLLSADGAFDLSVSVDLRFSMQAFLLRDGSFHGSTHSKERGRPERAHREKDRRLRIGSRTATQQPTAGTQQDFRVSPVILRKIGVGIRLSIQADHPTTCLARDGEDLPEVGWALTQPDIVLVIIGRHPKEESGPILCDGQYPRLFVPRLSFQPGSGRAADMRC